MIVNQEKSYKAADSKMTFIIIKKILSALEEKNIYYSVPFSENLEQM